MECERYKGLQFKIRFTEEETRGQEKGEGCVLQEDSAGWSGSRLRFKSRFLHVLCDPE